MLSSVYSCGVSAFVFLLSSTSHSLGDEKDWNFGGLAACTRLKIHVVLQESSDYVHDSQESTKPI